MAERGADEGTGDEQGRWLLIPSPEAPPSDVVLWHYTNAVGLIGILQSERLWASSAAMLNDATELTYGLDLAKTVLQEFKSEQDLHPTQLRFVDDTWDRVVRALEGNDIFVLCASEQGDDLGQWRAYAEGSGYSIGLAPGFLAAIRPGRNPTAWSREAVLPNWRRVVYGIDDQRELLREAWSFAAIQPPHPDNDSKPGDWGAGLDSAESALTGVITYIKNPGFVSERETRFVFDGRRFGDLTLFRAGALGVTPYIELGKPPVAGSVGHVTTPAPDSLDVVEVRVGPAQDQSVAARGIRSLLDATGRRDVRVSLSLVPYR